MLDRRALIKTPGWRNWFVSRDELIKSTQNGDTKAIDGGDTTISAADEVEGEQSFLKIISCALCIRHNYLFMLMSGLFVMPFQVIANNFLSTYLHLKFPEDISSRSLKAQLIIELTKVGGGIGGFLFGFISKRYAQTCPYLNRILCCAGFLLSGSVLFIIYIPSEYLPYWLICILALIHGVSLGTVVSLYSAVNEVNGANNSADFASSLVQFCGVMATSVGFSIFGGMMESFGKEPTVADYNKTCVFVVVLQVIGFVAACFVPRNLQA